MKKLDLTGQRFGLWLVTSSTAIGNKRTSWFCRCDCGNERAVDAGALRSGSSISCGCYRYGAIRSKRVNLTAEMLRSAYRYCPETGRFYSAKTGDVMAENKNTSGHLTLKIFSRSFLVHRLAWLYMTGQWPIELIDHKNTVKSDNKWHNLREATHSQNEINKGLRIDNKSGAKGVTWSRQNNKWRARCRLNGKMHSLGLYPTIEMAMAAYNEFAISRHGSFINV